MYVCWNFKLAEICVIDVIIHQIFFTFFSFADEFSEMDLIFKIDKILSHVR